MIQSRLTAVGRIFLGLAALFYAAAITSQSGLLLLLIGLIAGCLLANWFYSRNVLKGLLVEPPKGEFISEGSSPQRPWRIANKGKRDAEQVDFISAAGRLLRLKMLLGGKETSAIPELVYTRRGVYPHDELRLATSAPFGLIRSTRKLQHTGEIVVYPRIYEAPMPAVSGLDMLAGGKLTGNRRVTSGAHFAGVRTWQPGDPIRQIHWKSSARGPDLMVKTFDEELAGRVAVIISCDGARGEVVDDCVRAAGSVIMTALQGGHQVAVWNAGNENFQNIPPFSDGSEVLHDLARFEPKPVRWETVVDKIPRRSAVALVSARLRPPEEDFLRQLSLKHRRCTVYLPAGTDGNSERDCAFHFDAEKIWAASREGEVAA